MLNAYQRPTAGLKNEGLKFTISWIPAPLGGGKLASIKLPGPGLTDHIIIYILEMYSLWHHPFVFFVPLILRGRLAFKRQ